MRALAGTAMARIVPAFTCAVKLDDGSIIMSICPAIMSCTAGPSPR